MMADDLIKLHDFTDYDQVRNNLEKIFTSTLEPPEHSTYEQRFIWGAIRRTHSLSLAMRQSIEAKNGQMVATLLRLNLDTLARFYTLRWADETSDLTSEGFAKQVLEGKEIRSFHLGADKKKALDSSLIKKIKHLGEGWIEDVYKNASGAIHFSDFHIWQVFSQAKILKVISKEIQEKSISMDPTDQNPDIEDYQKAKTAFLHISTLLVAEIDVRVNKLSSKPPA